MTLFFVIVTGLLFFIIIIDQQIYNKKLQRVRIKKEKTDSIYKLKK